MRQIDRELAALAILSGFFDQKGQAVRDCARMLERRREWTHPTQYWGMSKKRFALFWDVAEALDVHCVDQEVIDAAVTRLTGAPF